MRSGSALRGVIAALLCAAATPLAAAPAAEAVDPMMQQALSLESMAMDLGVGGYLWRDDAPEAGPVTLIVSVPLQRAYAFRDTQLIGVASVSTGRPGKDTPRGAFTILQKRQHHRSNIYSNAPMPFMQRLTWTGIALHGGHNPGYPASHGCIRLPMPFARLLFGATALGAEVQVVDDRVIAPPPPEEFPVPILVAQALPEPDQVFARGWRRYGSGAPQEIAMAPGRRALIVADAGWSVPDAFLRLPAR